MVRTIVLLLAMLLAAPASAEDAVSFRLNWYMGGAHAPFFLGKERGYYHDAGIDLTINEGRGSAILLRSLPPAPTHSGWLTPHP